MRKYYTISLLLIISLAVIPFVFVILGGAIVNAANCTLNEAEVHSCIIYGYDYGQALYAMGMSIWLIIFTAPLAELAFIIWALSLTIHLVVRRQRKPLTEQAV